MSDKGRVLDERGLKAIETFLDEPFPLVNFAQVVQDMLTTIRHLQAQLEAAQSGSAYQIGSAIINAQEAIARQSSPPSEEEGQGQVDMDEVKRVTAETLRDPAGGTFDGKKPPTWEG